MSASNWTNCPKCQEKETNAIDHSLREDWEIGIYNGKFYVRYEANCTHCDFRYTFKHEDMLKGM